MERLGLPQVSAFDRIHWEVPRIITDIQIDEAANQVFPDGNSRSHFLAGLKQMVVTGAEVSLGGRRLRQMLGCKVEDRAGLVRIQASLDLYPHQEVRLGQLLKLLKEYPDEEMARPDLDFFVSGNSPDAICDIFSGQKLKTRVHAATGNVPIAVVSQNGSATFVDVNCSWQTRDFWPPYSAKAPIVVENNRLVAKVDLGTRFQLYPLELPGIENLNPNDPRRLAAVGRTLLYMVSASDIHGSPLLLPSDQTKEAILETTSGMGKIVNNSIESGKVQPEHRSGLRDFSLALMIMLAEHLDRDCHDPFFYQLLTRWQFSMFDR